MKERKKKNLAHTMVLSLISKHFKTTGFGRLFTLRLRLNCESFWQNSIHKTKEKKKTKRVLV